MAEAELSPDPQVLTLRPFDEPDRDPLTALLDNPRLYRRKFVEGVGERHPLEWAPDHLSFVVHYGDELFGVAELKRDEDEPHTWSFSVTLDRHAHKGDGGRCATLLVDYAFQHLEADHVWFWVRQDNIPVQRFGARLGFDGVCAMNVPGGAPCELFELSHERWAVTRPAATMHYMRRPAVLDDGALRLEGRDGQLALTHPFKNA